MQYKEILKNITRSWLWKVDTAGKYIWCSDNVYNCLGFTAEEVLGRTPFSFMQEEESLKVSSLYKDFLLHKDNFSELENTNIHKDGSLVICKTSAIPVYDIDGVWLGYEGIDQDISRERNLELELKKSYETLYKLTENIPGAIFQYRLYPDGRATFPYVSSGVEKLLELTPDEVLKDASVAFNRLHPDDFVTMQVKIEESAKTMTEWQFEYRMYLPSIGLRWIFGQAKPEKLEDGSILWHGYIKDITQRILDRQNLLSQAKLLEQKTQEMQRVIQDAPNPMVLHEEGGKILLINQAWFNYSGYSFEETPNMCTWIEHIYDDEETRISVKKHIASLYKITEKLDEGSFTFLNKKREQITWQFSSAPFGTVDGKRVIISTAMDITELKHKDEMLISQSRHAAMGEMIGMIAHQWRQPLSTISMDANNMLLDIAIDNFSSDEAEKYANSISAQTQHLSQTIDDFRNFFKPDKEIVRVNIRDILKKTLSIVKDSLKNNTITFTSSFETQTEVDAYPRELMQVFVSIITNSKDALVYTKKENAFITVRVFEDEKYVNTEICDNGGGIADDILPKVFDPYFSTKNDKNGTGLGLYMSKTIIEDHLKGLIEVYNDKNGTCFNVRLLKNLPVTL